jgi:nitroimidazol reductase NimA-like FMN-containing flavoprotein (pyridoxamine 5'-phosphate oxidase superfamily)
MRGSGRAGAPRLSPFVVMLKVKAMSMPEIVALLRRGQTGHLGCTRDGHPYVVPMHYAFDSECLYFFTTEGTKTEYIAANREVCFQVEEVSDVRNWSSVMALGPAVRLDKPEEMERAMRLIAGRNPTLEPAVSETKIGPWRRFNNIVIYSVRPHSLHGRKTA